MIEDFDIDAYCAAMKKFNECAEQYVVIDGMNCYMSESAPEEAKEAYKNSMFWVGKKWNGNALQESISDSKYKNIVSKAAGKRPLLFIGRNFTVRGFGKMDISRFRTIFFCGFVERFADSECIIY